MVHACSKEYLLQYEYLYTYVADYTCMKCVCQSWLDQSLLTSLWSWAIDSLCVSLFSHLCKLITKPIWWRSHRNKSHEAWTCHSAARQTHLLYDGCWTCAYVQSVWASSDDLRQDPIQRQPVCQNDTTNSNRMCKKKNTIWWMQTANKKIKEDNTC